MTEFKINVGDICRVFPHDPEWENAGSIRIGNTEDIVWIPRGSHVILTRILENVSGEVSWCHVMFAGHHVEISADLLEPDYEHKTEKAKV